MFGVLFLDTRFWILCLLLARCFISRSSFLKIILVACKALRSWRCCSWTLRVLRGVVSTIVACLQVVGRCFKGYFVGEPMRVIEDILLQASVMAGVGAEIMAMRLIEREVSTSEIAR